MTDKDKTPTAAEALAVLEQMFEYYEYEAPAPVEDELPLAA